MKAFLILHIVDDTHLLLLLKSCVYFGYDTAYYISINKEDT